MRKSARTPARLEPADLGPLVRLSGVGGALERVAMLGGFHFVTRIADTVGIESDLPIIQQRWRWLRTLGVRLQGAVASAGRCHRVRGDARCAERRGLGAPHDPMPVSP